MRWNYVILCTMDKDITSECYNVWIDSSNNMPEMDMMICETSQGLGRSQLGAVTRNIISRTNELVLYVIVIELTVS